MSASQSLRASCFAIALAAAPAPSFQSVAEAGPFDPSLVGSDAKFVAHIDFDAARESAVGQRLLDYVRDDFRYAEAEDRLVESIGFMPLSDIADLTLWSDAHAREPKTVLIMHAEFNPVAVRSGADFTPDLRVDEHNGQEVLNWAGDGDERVYACIFDDQTMLFSGDEAILHKAIDVLNDASLSLDGESNLPRPTDPTTWAFAAATDFATTPDAARNPIAKQLSGIRLEVGENAQATTVLRVSATTLADDAAPRLAQLATGAKMLAQLGMSTSPTTRPAVNPRDVVEAMLPTLLDATEITANARDVTITMSIPNDRAVELLHRLAEAREAELDAAVE